MHVLDRPALAQTVSGLASFKLPVPMKSSALACYLYLSVVCLNGWLKGVSGYDPSPSNSSLIKSELATAMKNTAGIISKAMRAKSTILYALGAIAVGMMAMHDSVLMAVKLNKVREEVLLLDKYVAWI